MEYTIAVYDKDRDSKCFLIYKAFIAPHIGEEIYFPHYGLYTIKKVVYNISDDNDSTGNNSFREEIMFIDIVVEKNGFCFPS